MADLGFVWKQHQHGGEAVLRNTCSNGCMYEKLYLVHLILKNTDSQAAMAQSVEQAARKVPGSSLGHSSLVGQNLGTFPSKERIGMAEAYDKTLAGASLKKAKRRFARMADKIRQASGMLYC